MSLSNDRLSDTIFNSLNRFYVAKRSGGLSQNELSEMIKNTGILFANKISQGKVSEDEIDYIESFVPYSEIEQNLSNRYFSIEHKGLNEAAKIFVQGDAAAVQKIGIRNFMAKPLFDSNDYREGFKRL